MNTRVLLFLLFGMLSIQMYGQTKIGSYEMSYFNRSYVVSRGLNSLMIEVQSEGALKNKFIIDEADVSEFIRELDAVRVEMETHTNSHSIAETVLQNKVRNVTINWRTSEDNFVFKQTLTPTIRFVNNKLYLVLYKRVSSHTNKNVKNTFYMFFESVDEFNNFIKVVEQY